MTVNEPTFDLMHTSFDAVEDLETMASMLEIYAERLRYLHTQGWRLAGGAGFSLNFTRVTRRVSR
jgi:hypothetical protein